MLKSKDQYCVLIEIGGSHDECLISQMEALTAAHIKPLLITTKKIIERNPAFQDYCHEVHQIEDDLDKRVLLKVLMLEYSALKKAYPNHKVVLNTAQGWVMKRFCVRNLFSRIEFIGIFHDALKYKSSLGQRLIRLKVRKSIFLADFLIEFCGNPKNTISFYPIFSKKELIKHEHNGINIAVIGGVETIKKDLEGFKKKIASAIPTHVTYYFLGKSDEKWPEVIEFKSFLTENGLLEKVILFDEFLSEEIFIEHLAKIDAVLPLIHPNTPSGDIYFRSKISGSMHVALTHKIPLLLHDSLENIEELKHAAKYYNFDTFPSILEEITVLKRVEANMRKSKAYNFQTQQDKYIKFIFEH